MAEAAVLALFKKENKPFSLQNLVDLLAHQGHKKAAITKGLDSLVESGKVVAKEFGKTKIFIPPQAGYQVLSKEELDAKKAEIKEHTEALKVERDAVKALESELSGLRSALTVEQMQAETKALTAKLKELEGRLAPLRTGAVLITPEERAAVEKTFIANLEAWRKRKGIFKNVWSTLSESLEGRKDAEVFEEMGVDTDESVGADYKALEALLPGANKRRRL